MNYTGNKSPDQSKPQLSGKVLVLRCAPVEVVEQALEYLNNQGLAKEKELVLAVQPQLIDDTWPHVNHKITLPEGRLEPEELSVILSKTDYTHVYLPIPKQRLGSYENIILSLRKFQSSIIFENGSIEKIKPFHEKWAQLGTFNLDWQLKCFERLRRQPNPNESTDVLMLLSSSNIYDSRVFRHAVALGEIGLKVKILAGANPNDSEPRKLDSKVWLERVDFTRPVLSGLLDRGLDIKPRIVFANEIETLGVGHQLAMAHGVKLAYDTREVWWGQENHDRRKNELIQHYRDVENRCIDDLEIFLCESPYAARVLEKRYEVSPQPIRNVCPLPDPVIDDLGNKLEDKKLIFTGRMTTKYHCEKILKSLKHLPQEITLHAWVTKIDQSIHDEIQKFDLAEKVFLHSPVPPDDVSTAIQTGWLGIVPIFKGYYLNHDVSLPNKLFEALSAGLPVVCGNAPEIKRVVNDHGLGIVIDENEIEGFVRAIQRFYQDRHFYEECYQNVLSYRRKVNLTTEKKRLQKLFMPLKR